MPGKHSLLYKLVLLSSSFPPVAYVWYYEEKCADSSQCGCRLWKWPLCSAYWFYLPIPPSLVSCRITRLSATTSVHNANLELYKLLRLVRLWRKVKGFVGLGERRSSRVSRNSIKYSEKNLGAPLLQTRISGVQSFWGWLIQLFVAFIPEICLEKFFPDMPEAIFRPSVDSYQTWNTGNLLSKDGGYKQLRCVNECLVSGCSFAVSPEEVTELMLFFQVKCLSTQPFIWSEG